MVFTMPVHTDGIAITRDLCAPRNIAVAAGCPPAMQREGLWRVEDFDLHKQLYKGKASLLYSATCKQSGIPVALKLYRKSRLSDLNWYQVEREIRLHIALCHPSIIQLYAAFEDDQHVYMAQEFASGGDLYEELKRSGSQFKEKRASRDVLQPCLMALSYLHSKGIIHRDIKPENILLTSDKAVKLADFGLSIDASEERPVTRAGTLDYMAPEVLVCPEKSLPAENKDKVLLGYTDMVDAWAMGILAFELMVGHPPFEKQSRAQTYEHIMYRKPTYPAWMSDEGRDFISTALTKAARKRPSVEELVAHAWVVMYQPRALQPGMARELSMSSELSARTTMGLEGTRSGPLASDMPSDAGARMSGLSQALGGMEGVRQGSSSSSMSMASTMQLSIDSARDAQGKDSETGLTSVLSWSASSIRNGVMKLLSSSGSQKSMNAAAAAAAAAAADQERQRQQQQLGHRLAAPSSSAAGPEQAAGPVKAQHKRTGRSTLDYPQAMATAAAAKAAAKHAAAQLDRPVVPAHAEHAAVLQQYSGGKGMHASVSTPELHQAATTSASRPAAVPAAAPSAGEPQELRPARPLSQLAIPVPSPFAGSAAASPGRSPGTPDSMSSLPSPFANVSPRVSRLVAPLSRRRAMAGTGQASSSNLGDTAIVSTAGSYSPHSTTRLALTTTASGPGSMGRRNSAVMLEAPVQEASESTPPIAITAGRSKSVVLPSYISDPGIKAVQGSASKALKPSRMSSQGMAYAGVMQGAHPAQMLAATEGGQASAAAGGRLIKAHSQQIGA